MIFTETPLPGAYVVDIEPRADDRGYFARGWCEREFREHGLTARPVQLNLSYNRRRGTLRGLHFQRAPWAEAKLVRCACGAVWDVIVDLRPASATYRRWFGAELSGENARMLYVPEGFAHGFVTLADDTAVSYHVSQFYTPGAEGGLRWNDPALGIDWPVPVELISDKDRAWPDFAEAGARLEGRSL